MNANTAPLAAAQAALPPAVATNPSVAQALQRLQASRRRLHDHWLPGPAAGGGGAGASFRHGGLAGLWRHWRRRLARVPGVDAVADALSGWWRHHPWRTTAELVTHEVVPQVDRVVRRHPLLAVTVAAGAGLALVTWKPWRQAWCRRQLQTLPHRVGQGLWHLAAQVPLHTLLAGLLGAASATAASAGAATDKTEQPTMEAPDA